MKAQTIKEFIELVSLGGTLEKLFLEPAPEGVKVSAKNAENTTFLVGILNNLTIKEALPIKHTRNFMAALAWVGGDVTLEKVKNRLFLSSTTNGKVRSQEIGLISEEYAKENYLEKLPAFEYEGGVTLETADLKDMSDGFAKLGEKHIRLAVENNKLTMTAVGDTDSAKIELPVEYYNCEGYYGHPLVKVIDTIKTKELQLFLNKGNDEYPAKITTKTENYLVSYIMANLKKPENIEEPKEPEVETTEVASEFKK